MLQHSSERYGSQASNAPGAAGSFCYMSSEHLQEQRRERLRAAVDYLCGGNETEFGRRLGYKDGGFVRQMLSGGKSITEKTILKIEAIPRLEGWFGAGVLAATARRDVTVAIDLEGNSEFPAIPKVRFKLSAGTTGFTVEHIEDGSDPIVFRRQWFESRGYRPEKLFAVAVTNGSMEPTVFAGDLVVVNTEDTTLKDGAVVAANFEGEPVVKRLQRDEGQWWLASDNPDKRRYPRKLCTPEVKIIGRVVHKQSETI